MTGSRARDVRGGTVGAFLEDESGGFTIWSLLWFLVYAAIGGLAIDVTNAYRVQTELQATADAAALAGALVLPDQTKAHSAAVAYADYNMNPQVNGSVLKTTDVTVGRWSFDSDSFSSGGTNPNAVQVVVRRAEANGNPVDMTALRIAGLFGLNPRWNVAATAIAVRFVPACLDDGLVALHKVDMGSLNHFMNNICVHGQEGGVDLQNGNIFDPGTHVSTSDLKLIPGRQNLMTMNPGLAKALREGDLWPRDVGRLEAIMKEVLSLGGGYDPAYDFLYPTGSNGLLGNPKKVKSDTLPPVLEPFTIYEIDCKNQIELPAQLITNVAIVANCRIHGAAGVQLENVVLASKYTGPQAAVDLAAGSRLGKADDCALGGGVEVYASGDVMIAARGEWNGLRIVAGNDVKFTSNNNGIHGLSVEAGHDIIFSSNNDFGLCHGGVPGPFAWHYRLVR